VSKEIATGCQRCSTCALDWPLGDDYRTCKQCGEKTDPVSNIRAMPVADALSLANHLDFERYYEKRGSRPSLRQGEFNDRFTLDGWKHEVRIAELAKHRKTNPENVRPPVRIAPSVDGRSHPPRAA